MVRSILFICTRKDERETNNTLLVHPGVEGELVGHSRALLAEPEGNLLLGRLNRVTAVADVPAHINGAVQGEEGRCCEKKAYTVRATL